METEVKYERWRRFKSGLSITSILALLYAMVVFIPAQIYLTLMTGAGGVTAALFTLLLWIELGKLSGKRITKQEAFMILTLTGAATFIPLGYIYSAWYRASSQAKLFDIAPYIPDWVAPAPEIGVLELRTFLHPAWALPISVGLASSILGSLLSWGLGFFAREMFIETERLPFPIQNINAEVIITLSEGKKRSLYVLSVFSLFGFIYGFFLYAIPNLQQAVTGTYVQMIPIPWVDLNKAVEVIFPGANLGIATDLGPIASALVLDTPIIVGIIMGSFVSYFLGSWMTVAYNLIDIDPLKSGVQSWWIPGMPIRLAWQRYLQFFYAMPLVGIGFAVGIGPLLRHPEILRKLLRSFIGKGGRVAEAERLTDPISYKKVIIPFIATGMCGYIILFSILVPEFIKSYPWFLVLMSVMPFMSTLIVGRMVGQTGLGSFPSGTIQNMIYYFSGYSGVDIWFAPSPFSMDGTGILTTLRVAQLTETRADSLVKMYYLIFPISILVGFFFMQIFWSIAPIPSARYPGIQIYWNIDATMQSLWIKGRATGMFRPLPIFVAFILGLGLYFAMDLLKSPVSFVALSAGLGTITPIAVTMLIGLFVKMVFQAFLGKKWFERNKTLMAAGLGLGESIAATLGLSVSLIINSIWMPLV